MGRGLNTWNRGRSLIKFRRPPVLIIVITLLHLWQILQGRTYHRDWRQLVAPRHFWNNPHWEKMTFSRLLKYAFSESLLCIFLDANWHWDIHGKCTLANFLSLSDIDLDWRCWYLWSQCLEYRLEKWFFSGIFFLVFATCCCVSARSCLHTLKRFYSKCPAYFS